MCEMREEERLGDLDSQSSPSLYACTSPLVQEGGPTGPYKQREALWNSGDKARGHSTAW